MLLVWTSQQPNKPQFFISPRIVTGTGLFGQMKTVKLLNPAKYNLGYFKGDIAEVEAALADKMIAAKDAELIETKPKKETAK